MQFGDRSISRSGDVRSACLSADDCLNHLEGRADPGGADATQKHLDDCPGCCAMMAEAARGDADGAPRATRALLTLALGNRVAGRYEIRRFIARGGMGEVYEAFDSVLQERVALKTLVLAALDQDEAAERLIREVRIARRVIHPNVCRIMDVGFHHWPDAPDRPVPFLTMDYLAGETLARRIARAGPLAPADARRFARDLCAGLGAVHHAGIIHRDLKSENVFLVRGDDGGERAVVMDFGLAWALEREASARRSSGRSVLGTVDYMSPEQVEGRALTPATDVYALGVVMFEMLVGRAPFSGDSAAAVALSRLTREAPKASSVVPHVGPNWDALIARCLLRDPDRRFGSANDVAAGLDALERRRPRARRAALVAAMALGLAALAAGVVAVRPGARPVQPHAAHPVAVAAPAVASTLRPERAPAVALSRPDPQPPAEPLPRRRQARPTPGAARLAPPQAVAVAETAAVALPATVAGDGAPAILDRGEELLANGKIGDACAAGEQAMGRAPAFPAVHRFLGRCYMRLGQSARARANYRRYLELAPSAPDTSFVRAIVATEQR
jgi:tRNA A-37 threonylcarbamoyl transferase component Bud32